MRGRPGGGQQRQLMEGFGSGAEGATGGTWADGVVCSEWGVGQDGGVGGGERDREP